MNSCLIYLFCIKMFCFVERVVVTEFLHGRDYFANIILVFVLTSGCQIISLFKTDTSLKRTINLVRRVPTLERVHCICLSPPPLWSAVEHQAYKGRREQRSNPTRSDQGWVVLPLVVTRAGLFSHS